MRVPIAKEGFVFIKIFASLAIFFYITGYYVGILYFLSGVSFVLMIFMLSFFRDPQRRITGGENLLISPADGKIIDIKKETHKFLNTPCNVIKIFMSVFNVHIQRAPIDGVVKFINYQPGKFLPAYNEEVSEKNEQNIIAIEFTPSSISEPLVFQILVKQIAGILARRIVCWCKEKDKLIKGQRIGLIKFSSQVDLYLPENIKINVKKGDKLKAGVTVIGEISYNYKV